MREQSATRSNFGAPLPAAAVQEGPEPANALIALVAANIAALCGHSRTMRVSTPRRVEEKPLLCA